MTAGVAFSEAGVARAGMGDDAADYDGSGRPSLVVGNFSNEMMALYHNEGNGLFIDDAATSAIGQTLAPHPQLRLLLLRLRPRRPPRHLRRQRPRGRRHPGACSRKVRYAQPPHLFRNLGNKKFAPADDTLGADFKQPMVGAGAAYADYDNDGDLDVLITANNGPARLLRNDGGNRNRWLRVRTEGTTSNRDGIGAKVAGRRRGQPHQWRMVKTGSSYCSQSELPVTFGLGSARPGP